MERNTLRTILFQMDLSRRPAAPALVFQSGAHPGPGPAPDSRQASPGGRTDPAELADACSLDAATLSRALDRLEEMGLIRREEHPGSRRSYLVRLTDAGREKAAKVQEGFDRVDELLCQGFSQEEQERLRRDLEHIRTNLDRCETLFGGKST